MSTRAINPVLQFIGDDGKPLASGRLDTFIAGTSTPVATYSDKELTVRNPVSIPLDSAGATQNDVFLDPTRSYKFVVKDSSGNTVFTRDYVSVPSGDGPSPVPTDELWGHWVSVSGWRSVSISWMLLGQFYKAEGNLGGDPDPDHVEDEYPTLEPGLYHYDMELAFQSGSGTGYVKYDLKIAYGDNTLRAMSFAFDDIASAEVFTEWCSGLFRLDESGEIRFYAERTGGSAYQKVKVSHFFAYRIG